MEIGCHLEKGITINYAIISDSVPLYLESHKNCYLFSQYTDDDNKEWQSLRSICFSPNPNECWMSSWASWIISLSALSGELICRRWREERFNLNLASLGAKMKTVKTSSTRKASIKVTKREREEEENRASNYRATRAWLINYRIRAIITNINTTRLIFFFRAKTIIIRLVGAHTPLPLLCWVLCCVLSKKCARAPREREKLFCTHALLSDYRIFIHISEHRVSLTNQIS